MVVASTFAMADVDGTNFYLRTEGFGVAEVIAPALQPGVQIQPRLRKDPESTTQTVPVVPHRNQICGAPSRFSVEW